MKRILISLLAAGALVGAVSPAIAQGPWPSDWRPLAERQDDIARRIDNGVASGALTDLQARDLRDQFKGLLKLEDDYRKTGLTLDQRKDLQARYDTLALRLRVDAAPADGVPARAYYPASAPNQ
jgi:hypothetical protein